MTHHPMRPDRPAAAQESGVQALPAGSATWIRPSAPIVLPASVRHTIACDAGTLWITQGDGEDYILTAGQCLALTPKDEVIVSAMAVPAAVRRIAGPCAPEPARKQVWKRHSRVSASLP